MKIFFYIIILIVVITNSAFASERVAYLTDTIATKDGNYIRLMGGTSWELTSMSLALPTDDIIIIFHNYVSKNGQKTILPILYHDGEEIVLRYISGHVITQNGYLTTVVRKFNNGAILKTDDGFILSIPQYDCYDTGWWLPPYKILITNNQMYLWNLNKGKKVWIDNIRK